MKKYILTKTIYILYMYTMEITMSLNISNISLLPQELWPPNLAGCFVFIPWFQRPQRRERDSKKNNLK